MVVEYPPVPAGSRSSSVEHAVDDLAWCQFGGRVLGDRSEHEPIVRVVGNARLHGEQLVDRDVGDIGIHAREIGEDVGDRVVEGQLAGVDSFEDRRRSERLGHAADAAVIVDGRVGAVEHRLAVRGAVLAGFRVQIPIHIPGT